MNFASSPPAIGLRALSRSITSSTAGWNLDCDAIRFCSSGERFTRAEGSVSALGRGDLATGGNVTTPFPFPVPLIALLAPELVTVTVWATAIGAFVAIP